MWIQIPTALVHAELNGEVPQDTILALAGFLIGMTTTQMEFLPEDAIQTAQRLYETGQIVTSHGEIISVQKNPERATSPNQVSEPLEKSWLTQTYEKFKTIWPDEVGPDNSMLNQIIDTANYDFELVDDILTILEASTTPISNPPILTLWWLNNREAKYIKESADIVRRKATDLTYIQRAIRESDRKMREAEKPAVTSEHLQRLQSLKEQLRSGRY